MARNDGLPRILALVCPALLLAACVPDEDSEESANPDRDTPGEVATTDGFPGLDDLLQQGAELQLPASGLLGDQPVIPAGEFQMGARVSDPGFQSNQAPAHRVKITRAFHMMDHEVTRAEWRMVFEQDPSTATECSDNCPVETVNWYEALSFANGLSRRHGFESCYLLAQCNTEQVGHPDKPLVCGEVQPARDFDANGVLEARDVLRCAGYRLPTEAEWEHAYRAGGQPLPDLSDAGHCAVTPGSGSTTNAEKGAGGEPFPVKTKQPNSLKVHDLPGNVYEWTGSPERAYDEGDAQDPLPEADADAPRVIRGGSFASEEEACEPAARQGAPPEQRLPDLGFRLVRTINTEVALHTCRFHGFELELMEFYQRELGFTNTTWCGDLPDRFSFVGEGNMAIRDALLDGYWSFMNVQELVTHPEATAYCAQLGPGWRLPDIYQVTSLVTEDWLRPPPDIALANLYIHPLFRQEFELDPRRPANLQSNMLFWSSTRKRDDLLRPFDARSYWMTSYFYTNGMLLFSLWDEYGSDRFPIQVRCFRNGRECPATAHAEGDACLPNMRDCALQNGAGEQAWNAARQSWGSCKWLRCDPGHHRSEELCVSDIRACEALNGAGESRWEPLSMQWTPCEVVSCDPGHRLQEGACVANERDCVLPNGQGLQRWDEPSQSWGACALLLCDEGYHPREIKCVPDSEPCEVENGLGVRHWNEDAQAWGPCQILSCAPDFHLQGQACVSDRRACVGENGSGEQVWDALQLQWGSCVLTDCSEGFHLQGDSCVESMRSCAVASGSGVQRWVAGAWGACEAVSCDEDHHLEDAACMPDMRDCPIDNGTGREVWNGTSWDDCFVWECNPDHGVDGPLCRLARKPGYALVSAGSFTMGTPVDEVGREANGVVAEDEGPQHNVLITADFFMMRHEVTRSQWSALFDLDPSAFDDCEGCPVQQVSFFEALGYANALSQQDGVASCYTLTGCSGAFATNNYVCTDASAAADFDGSGSIDDEDLYSCPGHRLPTEAEWEFAYRAGGQTATYNGDLSSVGCDEPVVDPIAWYCGNDANRTEAVMQKQPNNWDLHDMSGNVWEWVWDRHGTYSAEPQVNPTGPSEGNVRVRRGGSFSTTADMLRAGYRLEDGHNNRNFQTGFRLVQRRP